MIPILLFERGALASYVSSFCCPARVVFTPVSRSFLCPPPKKKRRDRAILLRECQVDLDEDAR